MQGDDFDISDVEDIDPYQGMLSFLRDSGFTDVTGSKVYYDGSPADGSPVPHRYYFYRVYDHAEGRKVVIVRAREEDPPDTWFVSITGVTLGIDGHCVWDYTGDSASMVTCLGNLIKEWSDPDKKGLAPLAPLAQAIEVASDMIFRSTEPPREILRIVSRCPSDTDRLAYDPLHPDYHYVRHHIPADRIAERINGTPAGVTERMTIRTSRSLAMDALPSPTELLHVEGGITPEPTHHVTLLGHPGEREFTVPCLFPGQDCITDAPAVIWAGGHEQIGQYQELNNE